MERKAKANANHQKSNTSSGHKIFIQSQLFTHTSRKVRVKTNNVISQSSLWNVKTRYLQSKPSFHVPLVHLIRYRTILLYSCVVFCLQCVLWWRNGALAPRSLILLMVQKSQATTVWMVQKPCKSWDILHINWCRICSINSIRVTTGGQLYCVFLGTYLVFQRSIGFNFLHLDSKFHAVFFGDSNPFFWKNCRSSCIFVLQYLFVCSMICDMCVSGTWHLNLGCLQFWQSARIRLPNSWTGGHKAQQQQSTVSWQWVKMGRWALYKKKM